MKLMISDQEKHNELGFPKEMMVYSIYILIYFISQIIIPIIIRLLSNSNKIKAMLDI